MVSKNELQGFSQSWNQTAAWAQSQGIPRKDYYPIYQMDSTRLLTPGETPMSQAERTRAILAAHNPNQVTPVPGDKPNPTNILGNAVTDLRNIFTGLSPTTLIPNIFDTVKNTILHPATVIKPIGEILGGVATGNMGQVKTGFEQAAGLEGPGSILSWLPGVYDAGLYAQGGLSEVLSHPVTSFLDVAPFASAGRLIDAAATESRAATIAEKIGMTREQLRNASLPGMAKSFVLSRKFEDIGYLESHAKALTDANGVPLTIGDALNSWITAHTGMGKTLSAIMKGAVTIGGEETGHELAMVRPGEMAMDALGTGAQGDAKRAEVNALLDRTDPRTRGKTPFQIEHDESIDQGVRTAYALKEDTRQWLADEALATGVDVARQREDGTVGIYHTYGTAHPVVKTAKDLQGAQDGLIKEMGPAHRLTKQMTALDAQAASLGTVFGQSVTPAEQAVRKLDGQRRVVIDETPRKLGRSAKVREVAIDIKPQVDSLFGREGGAGEASAYTEDPAKAVRQTAPKTEAGVMGRIQIALDQKDYAGLREYTGVAKRRLDFANYKLREGQADDPALIRLSGQINALHAYAVKRLEFEKHFAEQISGEYAAELEGRGRPGKGPAKPLKRAFTKYLDKRRAFEDAVWDHPTADWIDVAQDKFVERLLAEEEHHDRFGSMTKVLRDSGVGKESIDRARSDPAIMAQLIAFEVRRASSSPFGEEIMSKEEMAQLWQSAVDATNEMRAEGHEVVYIPSVSTLDLRDIKDPGLYGVHIATSGKVARSSRGFERSLGYTAKRHDVAAGIHQGAKEALQIRGTIRFVDEQLTPHFIYEDDLSRTVYQQFLDQFDPKKQTWEDFVAQVAQRNFGLKAFDPQSTFGFTLPRWKPGGIYLPKGIADALPKMLDKGQFPMDGAWSKGTNLFRFSILALSPRYTAHVVFGGTFLLALRSSPRLLAALPDAMRLYKDEGDVPRETILKQGASQRAVDPVVYQSFHDSTRNVANRAFLNRGSSTALRWISQENIEKVQGIKWTEAGPIHWLKAVGDTNLKFTNAAANFQRAWAYSDFLKGAKKGKVKDPVTGEKLDWTDERVRRMAEHHVAKTLGDLQSMTQLERAWFTKLMPFYGWTKHILEFTGSYPVDHPFRASTLTVLANQDTAAVASGLPKRLQFLLFLGSPDIAGNVTATDVRFLDPLRDVANYATWQGWVSALNPIISAPLAMIDPQAIFGGVPLYPNVSYDQFYGIETAGAQGNPLTAVEQFVPQVGALDAALGISAQYRQLAQRNPNGFAKAIFQSLNVPFAQVQHLNLKQIAAKNELDRYQVAKQAATNAFDSGDFSAISGLSSVPDPLNSQWDVTPGSLQALYNQLLTEYPGTPPASTAVQPPSAPL